MNAPELHEIYELPYGRNKVEYIEDSRFPNAATYNILLEDHTIGNLLRIQLLTNPDVKFAGIFQIQRYRVPHPLENKIEIKIQTTTLMKPIDALNKAVSQLVHNMNAIASLFNNEVENYKKTHD